MTDQPAPAPPEQEPLTWSDPDPASARPAAGQVISTRELFTLTNEREERLAAQEAQTEARRHFMKVQLRVLSGVGLIFFATIITLVVGLWKKLIPEDFATELMRMTIPTVLGAGLTIVGAFFHNGGNNRGP
jgi:hypothetical protein